MFNAYYEGGHSYQSPYGTLLGFGPTSDQESMNNYDSLKFIVDQYVGGFSLDTWEYISLYLEEQNEFYDITFESWTPGIDGGGGGYTRTKVDPPSLTMTGSICWL